MERAEVVAGVFAEYDAFAELISGLTPDEWRTPTRCEGWQVCDVAGHVVGVAVDVSTGKVGSRTGRAGAGGARRGAGLVASVHWAWNELERLGWGPARIVLDGAGEHSIGTGGPVLRGDPLRFLLAATGRTDPAEFGVDGSLNIYSLR